jgi:hypothetical protein
MCNTNPLDFDQSSTQTDIGLAIIDRMCLCVGIFFLFQEKGVGQYNVMRKSGLRVRLGWILSFLSCLTICLN